MNKLTDLWVILKTSTKKDADADAPLSLVIDIDSSKAEIEELRAPFPNLPHDELEGNRTDAYHFDVARLAKRDIDASAARGNIAIHYRGNDAWLPESIWVIGRSEKKRNILYVAQPRWHPDKWFSQDTSDAGGLARAFRILPTA